MKSVYNTYCIIITTLTCIFFPLDIVKIFHVQKYCKNHEEKVK